MKLNFYELTVSHNELYLTNDHVELEKNQKDRYPSELELKQENILISEALF